MRGDFARSDDLCGHSFRKGRRELTSRSPIGMIAMALSTHLLACGVIDREGPIRWGVMGAGLISRDFVGALKALSPKEGVVVAVGARDLEGAATFARELSIERVHEGYEALAADPEVDVIYVGTVAQAHVQCCRIALAAGKHVVVEKPLALCASDVEALTREAHERGLFLLEGMWTRCFPAVRKARELLAAGAIGEVVAFSADFGARLGLAAPPQLYFGYAHYGYTYHG